VDGSASQATRSNGSLGGIGRGNSGPVKTHRVRVIVENQPQTTSAGPAGFSGDENVAAATALRGVRGRHVAHGQRAARGTQGERAARMHARQEQV